MAGKKMTLRSHAAITMQCRECLAEGRDTVARYASVSAALHAGWHLGDPGTTFLGICPDHVREANEEIAQDRDDEVNRGLLWMESMR